MKKVIHEEGIKGVLGDDLLTIQDEQMEALESLLTPYGNFILNGCEVENRNLKNGMCFLDGKVRRVSYVNSLSLPAYIVSKDYTEGERDYKVGGKKPAYQIYGTLVTTTKPTSGNYITINTDGLSARLKDVLDINDLKSQIESNNLNISKLQDDKSDKSYVDKELDIIKLTKIDTPTTLELNDNSKRNIWFDFSISDIEKWNELEELLKGDLPLEITHEDLLENRFRNGDLSNNLKVFFSCDSQRQELQLVFENGKEIWWERNIAGDWLAYTDSISLLWTPIFEQVPLSGTGGEPWHWGIRVYFRPYGNTFFFYFEGYSRTMYIGENLFQSLNKFPYWNNKNLHDTKLYNDKDGNVIMIWNPTGTLYFEGSTSNFSIAPFYKSSAILLKS